MDKQLKAILDDVSKAAEYLGSYLAFISCAVPGFLVN